MIKGKSTRGIGIFLLAVGLLTGCGSKNNENIEQGMTLISESDYSGALECFEAAMVYHEDEELLYRGQGIAYMGLYQYEEAIDSFLKSFEYADHCSNLVLSDSIQTIYIIHTVQYSNPNYCK